MTVLSAAGDIGIVLMIFALCGAVGAVLVRIPAFCRPAPERGRYAFLDGLRGVAALSVLAGHCAPSAKVLLDWPGGGQAFINLAAFGVQIFFALTGFLFTQKMIAAPDGIAVRPFMAARIRRIVPMYSVAVFASVLICIAVGSQEYDTFTHFVRHIILFYVAGFVNVWPPAEVRGIPYWHVLPQIWTLAHEWLFYVFVPILCVCFSSAKLLMALTVVCVAYFTVLAGGPMHQVFLPFFAPGMLLAYLTHRGLAVPPSWRPALLVVVVPLSLIAILSGTYNFTWWKLALMFGVFGGIVLMEPAALAGRTMAWLGQISYSIYLVSVPLFFLLSYPFMPLGQYHMPMAADFLLMTAGFVCLTLGLSALTFRFIEYPFLSRGPARSSMPAPEVLARSPILSRSQASTWRWAVAVAVRSRIATWKAVRQASKQ